MNLKNLNSWNEYLAGLINNAYRFRLQNKKGMMHLIQLINGHIRNSKKIPQLQRICNLYNIPFKDPIPLTNKNDWFSGFFDAEGSISYSMKRGLPQLVVSVSNKYKIDLIQYIDVFGGYIRLDTSSDIHKLYTEKAILNFEKYLKNYPSQSHKQKVRLPLIKRYYGLRV
jgi:hypothetical protein